MAVQGHPDDKMDGEVYMRLRLMAESIEEWEAQPPLEKVEAAPELLQQLKGAIDEMTGY